MTIKGCSIIALSLIWFFTVAQVSAEELTLFGVKFPVERIAEVDEKTSSITVLGETVLLAKEKVRPYVALKILSSPQASAKFDSAQLKLFFRHALDDSSGEYNLELAKQVFLLLAARPDSGLLSLILDTNSSANFSSLARKVLTDQKAAELPEEILFELIYQVGLDDPSWLRPHAEALISDQQAGLEGFIDQRLKSALTAGDFKLSLKVVAIAAELFGSTDSRYQRLKLVHEEMSRLSSYFEVGDLESIYPSLDAARKDPILRELVAPLLLKAIHREASKLLSQDRPDAALQILKNVELNKRTVTTHKLVEDALDRTMPGPNSALTDLQVELMLRSLSQKDPYVAKAYVSALERQVNYIATSGSAAAAHKLFERILELRPDPVRANDLVRLNLALSALDQEDRGLAHAIMNGIKAKLGVFNAMRLIFAGYYFPVWLVYLLFGLPIVTGTLLAARAIGAFKRKQVEFIGTGVRRNVVVPAQEEELGPGFIAPRAPDPELIQYEQYLSLFGLKPGVSEREVKAAYRNAVKEFHPDANPDSDSIASEKFIELTNAYDKILSFTRERFGSPEQEE